MPSYTYAFTRFKFLDGKTELLSHPRLYVAVSNPFTGDSVNLWGLIDTGADASLFPEELATMLGHNLKGNGVKSSFSTGIEQKRITTYKHTFKIDLISPSQKKAVWSTGNLEVDCADTNPPVLFGVQGFLKNFNLDVDYPNEIFSLKWK